MKAKFKLLEIILIVIILGIFTACGDDDPKQDNCSVCGKPVPCGTDHTKPTTPGTDPETDPCCTGNCNPCNCGNECTKDCCKNITPNVDIHSHDFTKTPNLLGLDNGTWTGSSIITKMNERYSNANVKEGFYPITSNPKQINVEGLVVIGAGLADGSTSFTGFVINSTKNSLLLCGYNTGGGNYTITFNVAVINNDGKGWLSGGSDGKELGQKTVILTTDNNPPHTRTYISLTTSSTEVSISDLTGGKIKTYVDLSNAGYTIYVIIRSVPGITDTNTKNKDCNVIIPQPLTN